MDDQRIDRASSGSMSELPKRRIRFSLKTLPIIVTIVAVYILAYSAGYHDGENSMMKYWMDKTAGQSAEK
jgi:hypothetical protein